MKEKHKLRLKMKFKGYVDIKEYSAIYPKSCYECACLNDDDCRHHSNLKFRFLVKSDVGMYEAHDCGLKKI